MDIGSLSQQNSRQVVRVFCMRTILNWLNLGPHFKFMKHLPVSTMQDNVEGNI